MSKAVRVKEKFYIIAETQRAREAMHNIIIIDNCITKIKEVIYQTMSRGKCKYL